MAKMILLHGSEQIVQLPSLGKGKPYNDYGQGFYCTTETLQACEWACRKNRDGFVNYYEWQSDEMKILQLNDPAHTVLNWIAVLLQNRTFRVNSEMAAQAREYLIRHFSIDTGKYDAIIGYRADDSYFSFARAFVNNEISLKQLSYAMKLGELGEQFVLKSEKAFSAIRFISCEQVSNAMYFPRRKQRDEAARAAFCEEGDRDDLNGLFIRDIIRERILPDDPRIR